MMQANHLQARHCSHSTTPEDSVAYLPENIDGLSHCRPINKREAHLEEISLPLAEGLDVIDHSLWA